MNSGIRTPSSKCQRHSRRADERVEVFSFGWETILEGGWIRRWPTTWRYGNKIGILPHYYFSWKGKILHQERRGQVITIVMEHLDDILFQKSGSAKQTVYQSTPQLSSIYKEMNCFHIQLLYTIKVRQRVFENRILRQIFGPKRDENGEWSRLHSEKLYSLYRSLNIARVIKSRRLKWTGHVGK